MPSSGSVCVSRKPPRVPTVALASTLPSGRRIETFVLQHVDVPTVTCVSSRLTRSPAVPAKASEAVPPAEAIVTVTGAPPGVIAVSAARGRGGDEQGGDQEDEGRATPAP